MKGYPLSRFQGKGLIWATGSQTDHQRAGKPSSDDRQKPELRRSQTATDLKSTVEKRPASQCQPERFPGILRGSTERLSPRWRFSEDDT